MADANLKLDDFDFIRFCWSDTHGISRARMIPRRNVAKFMQSGVGVFQGILALGADSGLYIDLPHNNGWPNSYAMPDLKTLRPIPWVNDGVHRVGQMLCDLTLPNTGGMPMPNCPRSMAKKQVERLRTMGLELYSSFETEMTLFDLATGKPKVPDAGFTTTFQMSKEENLLMEIDDLLKAASVDVESYQIEYGASQFEMPLAPCFGIEPADMMFVFRNGLKEICHKRGVDATFMTKPCPSNICNGGHYNHSLWTAGDRKSAFASADDSDGLSQIFRQWLGGLIKHAPALCAIYCPTVNCYRRLNQPWAPNKADWGIDNRLPSFRVKVGSSPFIENRIPSAACNPYLAIAATIAAGIDGIQTGSTCPPAMDPSAQKFPRTLQEALEFLQEDKVMTDALGEPFMQWYVPMKQELEIKRLPNTDVSFDDAEAIAAEVTVYGNCI
ncbi:hypothetical protein CAPTEDRAFT_219831 [Capitella teleta]|uniref:Lengsin n=1 Tax=Capitella teleta TaxID=283909 RepID=R7VIP4_CAPTE|nr:hypothetical protein CAPTEDRAFT_219831 [Capitella teleta]|eukprot:ELU18499.1 hypothetical protein CAPTEDRAFT_219831 [Capitella teleta]